MPLNRADVDTDQIIPAKYLKLIDRQGFGKYLFDAWKQDPGFVTNDPRYAGARVLVAGPNFGCGSSREHAPWALEDYGFRAIVAPSFGDIFFSNCFQNGVLPVILPPKVVDELAAEVEATQGKGKVKIDLHRCVVISPGGKETSFTIDAILREGMLKGLDQIELTRAREAQIAAFQVRDRASHPWIYAVPQ